MQRRAFELQAQDGEPLLDDDPLEEDPSRSRAFAPRCCSRSASTTGATSTTAPRSLARVLGQARRETIAGAGHLAPLEQAQAFRELLLDFVA